MLKILQLLLLGLCFIASPAWAESGLEQLDSTMKKIATELLIIDKALASDSSEGVQKAAGNIKQLSGSINTEGLTGEDSDKLMGLEKKIAPAAEKMSEATTIEVQRSILKDLSKPIVLWATIRQPEGLYVAYCPMAPGAWIQDERMISNPYYGASMLRCGGITERSDK